MPMGSFHNCVNTHDTPEMFTVLFDLDLKLWKYDYYVRVIAHTFIANSIENK